MVHWCAGFHVPGPSPGGRAAMPTAQEHAMDGSSLATMAVGEPMTAMVSAQEATMLISCDQPSPSEAGTGGTPARGTMPDPPISRRRRPVSAGPYRGKSAQLFRALSEHATGRTSTMLTRRHGTASSGPAPASSSSSTACSSAGCSSSPAATISPWPWTISCKRSVPCWRYPCAFSVEPQADRHGADMLAATMSIPGCALPGAGHRHRCCSVSACI